MEAVFIWKVYNKATNKCIKNDLIENVIKANSDMFAFYAFNCLAYDWEINGLFAPNKLFNFTKYYTLDISIKKVNL